MRLAQFGLFVLILGTGGVVETAYQVRQHVPGAHFSWRMFNGRFEGPSHAFDVPAQSFPLAAGQPVEVDNRFGNVKVVPGTGAEARVLLRTVVYDESQPRAAELARQVHVVTETTAGGFRITTNRDQVEQSQSDLRRAGIETHLEVQVPAGTVARVRNEHGDAAIWDMASVDLENGFGAVDVQRVATTARVVNRHGDTHLADVKGDVSLEAHHGDVTTERTGATKLDVEHGDVKMTECASVDATSAHGDHVFEKVAGDLRLKGEHTGVVARDVKGGVDIETGFRDIELTDIAKDVRVDSQHGAVVLARAGGTVKIQNRHDRVELTDITGATEIDVENGGVEARNLKAGAVIRARHDGIRIEGFNGPIQIAAENASVELAPGQALTASIDVRTTHDEVELRLPQGSAVELDARASSGEVDVELAGLTTSTRDHRHVAGRVGTGGAHVQLVAENGNIRVADVLVAPR